MLKDFSRVEAKNEKTDAQSSEYQRTGKRASKNVKKWTKMSKLAPE